MSIDERFRTAVGAPRRSVLQITADGLALRVGISLKSSFTGMDSSQFPVYANTRANDESTI